MPKSANTADEYDFVDHQETALSPETVAELREWLQPTDYLAESGEYRRHLLSQAPGTGLWICETEKYRKWHDSPDHGSLWIKGVPGAGKSVMAASLIQHLRTTENCPVLFFFFRNIVAANFSPRALIQDWLAQLLPHSPKLQFALQPRLMTSLAETSDNDLIDLFLDGVSCVPKLYCVGDALDEMSTDNTPFLNKLNSLATHRPRTLKLLMTSRPSRNLQSTLRDSSIVHISLQQRLVDVDILAYLNHRFDMSPKLDHHLHLKTDIINMVAQKSEGLFLYAKLTMDQVENSLQSNTTLDIKALEESLPVGLEQTYTGMLAKQRKEHGVTVEVQLLILEAVIHASRPLRLNELASLLKCIRPDIAQPNAFKALVTSSCGSLIEILEDETLQVIHHSFTEFLRGDTRSDTVVGASDFPIIYSPQAHKHMAMSCLQYLQDGSLLLDSEKSNTPVIDPSVTFKTPRHLIGFEWHRHGLADESDAFRYRDARLQYPFLSYAVENWSYHASHYDVADEEFFNAITGFLNPGSLSFLRWLVIHWGSTSTEKGSNEGIPTALHIAAFAGLSELALKLLQQGISVAKADAQERVPLHWAAANGHTKLVSLLIQHGTDPDAVDGRGLKPIHLAALRNYSEAVTLLLEAGVKPNTAKTKEDRRGHLSGGERLTKGECPIFYASRAGHTETIIAMIPFCEPDMLEQLLCQCCKYGQTDAVLAILNNSSVSPNATFDGATALYFACSKPKAKCVAALIEAGAEVNKVSQWLVRPKIYGSWPERRNKEAPLHRLAEVWNHKNDSEGQEALRILVKAGADLEQLDGHGSTPLHIAACDPEYEDESLNKLSALKALVKEGANVKAIGPPPERNNILHEVLSHSKDLEVVKLLVEHGCDVMEKNGNEESPLICAVDSSDCIQTSRLLSSFNLRRTSVVEYLLNQGADPGCKDKDGRTPVESAMSCDVDLFKLLLSRCKDKHLKHSCWFGLSGIYPEDSFTEHLEILVAEGMDMEMRDENGDTLFLRCLGDGSNELLRILRDHGARADAKDADGNTALHRLCIKNSEMETLKEFVDQGINPLEANNNGDTLLHVVAKRYKGTEHAANLLRWLISLDIPVNSVNSQGATPLHIYQKHGRQRTDFHNNKLTHFLDVLNMNGEVNLEIRDNDGLSPFHLAAMRSEFEVASFMSLGADLNHLTSDSQNILHLACRARKANIVGQILESLPDIDIDQQDKYGRTPLHYACSSGEPESVAWLLGYAAATYKKANDGSTVLHACADIKMEQNMWNIREKRADWLRSPSEDPLRPRSDNTYFNKPWYPAERRNPEMAVRKQSFPGVSNIIKMLVNHGIDVGELDICGKTALDWALYAGFAEFADVFAEQEELFELSIKHLDKEKDPQKFTYERPSTKRGKTDDAERVELIRKGIKIQMLLTRSKSCFDTMRHDEATFRTLVERPDTVLGILPVDDMARLVDECFNLTPLESPAYNLIQQLMKPSACQLIDHLAVIEKEPALVKYYSTYENVAARFEKQRLEGEYPKCVMTALAVACSQEESNMLTLKLLVEKLNVDINAPAATSLERCDNTSEIQPGSRPIHILAEADHYWQVEGLRYLLDNGADINALDKDGQTALHVAAVGLQYVEGFVKGMWKSLVVKTLLDRGADINALDKDSLSPLHKASSAPDIMKELLSRGANAYIGKQSPLFPAIADQCLATLEALLDHGLSVDTLDESQHSRDVHHKLAESRRVYPLLCAAFNKDFNRRVRYSVPLLRTLIERGASLYLPLNDTETLVHFLFEYPEYEVAGQLLEEPCVSGIDFNHRDQRGRTVLISACDWRETLPGFNYRHWDKFVTGPPVRMLDLGADATLVDHSGDTALHHLLRNPGQADSVLIDFINRDEVAPTLFQKDKEGYLPFHYALRVLRPRVCEAFLAKGAELLEPDPQGWTALHYIASQCLVHHQNYSSGGLEIELGGDWFDQCLSLWRKFLLQGGSINVVDKAGNTPLQRYMSSPRDSKACHLDHYSALFPEDSGVDIFAVNNAGEGVLHKIASRKDFYYTKDGHDKDMFVFMMERGLDPLKEDVMGRSALDVASACEKDDIVALLARK
ncbi:Ankyrin-3 [Fusarium austroafricanum]|uniref:Ankyrin-3 n=1 Tax=Fusarium austroafricanum TaxID=2364996 RepID=A0A8H4KTU9_9HYPO|nr:Ankyrin-3 [Fusarium austroafricanum]